MPEKQGAISLSIIILSVGMLLAFTVHHRLEESRKGMFDRPTMPRLIILDCVGIVLVLISAMAIGSYVSKVVGTAVINAIRTSAPEWAEGVAIVSSLLAALAARSVFGALHNKGLSA